MSASSTKILQLARLKPSAESEANVSVEEIRLLLSESQERGALPFGRLMLHENVFDLSQAKARDAMKQRDQVAYLSLAKPWNENLEVIKRRRFSRYPLCKVGLDEVMGFVHVKDLFLQPAPDLEKAVCEIAFVPESEPIERMLRVFPDRGMHMALVKNEAGTVSGLLTLEDLLEELVGEVQDEFDIPGAWSLGDFAVPAAVTTELQAATLEEAIRLLAERLSKASPVPAQGAIAAALERERRLPSAVGHGVAVPHARLPEINRSYLALGRFAQPVAVAGVPDRVPVRLVLLLVTPASTPTAQLKLLSRIAALASNETVRRRLLKAKTSDALLEAIRTADTLLAT